MSLLSADDHLELWLIAAEQALLLARGSPTYAAQWRARARHWRDLYLDAATARTCTSYTSRNADLRAGPPFPSIRL